MGSVRTSTPWAQYSRPSSGAAPILGWSIPQRPNIRSVPGVLIGLGVLLLVFTFLLAFTIFGELSAVLGVACLAVGSLMFSRRSSRQVTDPSKHSE